MLSTESQRRVLEAVHNIEPLPAITLVERASETTPKQKERKIFITLRPTHVTLVQQPEESPENLGPVVLAVVWGSRRLSDRSERDSKGRRIEKGELLRIRAVMNSFALTRTTQPMRQKKVPQGLWSS